MFLFLSSLHGCFFLQTNVTCSRRSSGQTGTRCRGLSPRGSRTTLTTRTPLCTCRALPPLCSTSPCVAVPTPWRPSTTLSVRIQFYVTLPTFRYIIYIFGVLITILSSSITYSQYASRERFHVENTTYTADITGLTKKPQTCISWISGKVVA